MNPADRYHKTAMMYLGETKKSERAHVPTSTLIEFDLVMRNNGYTENEISDTWQALSSLVQENYVATTLSAHLIAASLRAKGLSYFDSLITALAAEMDAIVVTRDDAISKHVRTEWKASKKEATSSERRAIRPSTLSDYDN
jgi:predicted nucleic acid-binding protein